MPTTSSSAPIPTRRGVLAALVSINDPVFGDERERRTWMEAYVIAYEVALLATIAVASAMIWVGGRPLLWWSVAVIWIIGLGNIVALRHLRSAGLADLPWRDRLRFWSYRLRLLLAAVWLVGFLRVMLADDAGVAGSPWPYVAGLGVGLAAAVLGLLFVDRRARARAAAGLPPDDTFED